jgi:hypothetical protein
MCLADHFDCGAGLDVYDLFGREACYQLPPPRGTPARVEDDLLFDLVSWVQWVSSLEKTD